MHRFAPLTAVAVILSLFAATAADAQTKRYKGYKARTIYVQPRSYLDPGKVVPIGSESQYVYIGQYDNPPPYYNQLRAQDTYLPRLDPRRGYLDAVSFGVLSGY